MNDKELIGKQLQSAFPSHGTMGEVVETGMTLRDYFAAKALAPIVAAERERRTAANHAKLWAEEAYIVADAMLAAREAA